MAWTAMSSAATSAADRPLINLAMKSISRTISPRRSAGLLEGTHDILERRRCNMVPQPLAFGQVDRPSDDLLEKTLDVCNVQQRAHALAVVFDQNVDVAVRAV